MQGFEGWKTDLYATDNLLKDPTGWLKSGGVRITSIKPLNLEDVMSEPMPTIRLLPPLKTDSPPYHATRMHKGKPYFIHHRQMKTFQKWCFENTLGCP